MDNKPQKIQPGTPILHVLPDGCYAAGRFKYELPNGEAVAEMFFGDGLSTVLTISSGVVITLEAVNAVFAPLRQMPPEVD